MATALELLRDRMAEDTLELSYDNLDGAYTLRLVLDSIGEAEDGVIVVEVSEVPVEDQEKYGYYHFMSVLANEVSEAQFKTTLAKLNDINMETLLGNYFVIPDVGALVHKYVLRVNNEDAKSTAEDLYACLVEVVAQVNNDYDRVVASIAE
ncbi:MAG: hypothetical protein IKO10_09110 [Lachnospiraceae bacterium]|nr:hypothetical protein [Lachnospiraceae bacterium]